MDCTSCGFALMEGSSTCPYCGAAAAVEPQAAEPGAATPVEPRRGGPAPAPTAAPDPSLSAHTWPSEPIDLQAVRSPDEKTAALALTAFAVMGGLFVLIWIVASLGLLLFVIAALAGAVVLAELLLHAHIKTNGVRVSATQYPDLHAASANFSQRMNLDPPELYVMQDCMWNAFAARFAGRGVVVLLSGAVDSILLGGRREDLGFLVGHELAHHALDHLDWKHRLLVLFGQWLSPWVAFWHRRHQELSCDRLALACTGDLQLCTRAVANMTVGARLAAETNVDEAIEQWERHKGEAFVLVRTIYSPYPHHLWRLANLRTAAAQMGVSE